MVFWIIGLAGAGKTTIAKALYSALKEKQSSTVFLDGDGIREIMGGDLGFSIEDRRINGWRICRLCKYLDDQGINVVCATLSQFHEQQEWNRANYSRYFEVYLKVDMSILIKRDQKSLYSGALEKKIINVVGIDIPFPAPQNSDLCLENSTETDNFSSFAERILLGYKNKFGNL